MIAVKWYAALLGWMIRGPFGALIGYLVGSVIDFRRHIVRRTFTYTYQAPPNTGMYTGSARRGLDWAYSELGLTSSATDDEVKSAYRRMAMKFHPDMVANMDERTKTSSEQKFRRVQEAYEAIKKQRNLN